MTLQELRADLDRTRPAWEAMDLDVVLALDQLPVWMRMPTGHQLVANEMLRRPSDR